MCGIGGVVGWKGSSDRLHSICSRMAEKLRHRGPDDQGIMVDERSGVGLVHTRLAILDLSPAGHQPMSTEDGRYTIVFNGEIYNFKSLRADLESSGVQFSSHSDTEVILKLFEREGAECVCRFIGMYAIAIWDRVSESLFLARGPLGIKPLYYRQLDGTMAFGSEIRCLMEPEFGPSNICNQALYEYFVHGSPQEPNVLVAGIQMLQPGHTLHWKRGEVEDHSAWNFVFPETAMSREDAVASTRQALLESVQRHFVSDVPVGIFLSGGIDSTAILALAREIGMKDLHTFSISFEESNFDEGEIAAKTAEHFGATHHSWKLNAEDAKQLIPDFAEALDQPSIDGFNVYCVSKLAHDHGMKVVLSGLGGDELFGSYPSFSLIPKLLKWYRCFGNQESIRRWIGQAFSVLPSNHRINRFGRFLRSDGTTLDAYHAVRGVFSPENACKLASFYSEKSEGCLKGENRSKSSPMLGLGDQISLLEMTHYMLNQLLRDADVMSMAHGLELRVPFVDIGLLKAISQVPSSIRLQSGKRLLIDAIPEIPEWVRKQPKRGFTFPFETWLRQQWRNDFDALHRRSPVQLSQWYQQWAVFSFERFVANCGIQTSQHLIQNSG